MDSRTEIAEFDWDSFNYIIKNLRKSDKKELTFQGFTDATYKVMPQCSTYCFIGKSEGDPCIVFGFIETERAVHIWLFGTPLVERHWKTVFEYARVVLDWVQTEHFGKHLLVWTWHGHTVARAWNKRLGFRPTKHKRTLSGELFELWERNN